MREKILYIIEIIIKQILISKEIAFDEKGIIEYLLSEGYNIEEINAAFSWIREIIGAQNPAPSSKKIKGISNTMRILNPLERMNFSPEAYGFLIRLKEFGFIDDDMQEEIIERTQYFSDGEIGLDEIKSTVALVVMSRSGIELSDDISKFLNDEWENSLN